MLYFALYKSIKYNIMNHVKNKLRVWHMPQVPGKSFNIPVANEYEAAIVLNALASQHLWLEKNGIIEDYSNVIGVSMLEDNEWTDYWNDEEMMDWKELEDYYFSHIFENITNENLC